MDKKPHPAKGKPREQYLEECRLKRIEDSRVAAEEVLRKQRLRDAGWDDMTEILKMVARIGMNAPAEEFWKGTQEIRERAERIASGAER